MEISLVASYNLPALAESGGLRQGSSRYRSGEGIGHPTPEEQRDQPKDTADHFHDLLPESVRSEAIAGYKRCSIRACFPCLPAASESPLPWLPHRLSLRVGRDPTQCDVVIPFALGSGPLLSRHHCRLSLALSNAMLTEEEGERHADTMACVFVVEDGNSLNGTFLDNRKVAPSATRQEGAQVPFDLVKDVRVVEGKEPLCTISFGGGSRVAVGEELPSEQLALRFQVFLRAIVKDGQPRESWRRAFVAAMRGMTMTEAAPTLARGMGSSASTRGEHGEDGGRKDAQTEDSKTEMQEAERVTGEEQEGTEGHEQQGGELSLKPPPPLPPPPPPPPRLPQNRSTIDDLVHSALAQHKAIAGDGMSVSCRSSRSDGGGGVGGGSGSVLSRTEGDKAESMRERSPTPQDAEEEEQQQHLRTSREESADGARGRREGSEPARAPCSVVDGMEALFDESEPIWLVRASGSRRNSGGVVVPVPGQARESSASAPPPPRTETKPDISGKEQLGGTLRPQAEENSVVPRGQKRRRSLLPQQPSYFEHELPRRAGSSSSSVSRLQAESEQDGGAPLPVLQQQSPSFSSYQSSQWVNEDGALPRFSTAADPNSCNAGSGSDGLDDVLGVDAYITGRTAGSATVHQGYEKEASTSAEVVTRAARQQAPEREWSSEKNRRRFRYRNGVLIAAEGEKGGADSEAGPRQDGGDGTDDEIIEVECTPTRTRPPTPPAPPPISLRGRKGQRPPQQHHQRTSSSSSYCGPLLPSSSEQKPLPSLTGHAVAAAGGAGKGKGGRNAPKAAETIARFLDDLQGLTLPPSTTTTTTAAPVSSEAKEARESALSRGERTAPSPLPGLRASAGKRAAKAKGSKAKADDNNNDDDDDIALGALLRRSSPSRRKRIRGEKGGGPANADGDSDNKPHQESLLLRYQRQKREKEEEEARKAASELTDARTTVTLSPRSTHGAIQRATALPAASARTSSKRVSFQATSTTTRNEESLVGEVVSQPLSAVEPDGWFGSQSQLVFIPTPCPSPSKKKREGDGACKEPDREASIPSRLDEGRQRHDEADEGSAFSQYERAGGLSLFADGPHMHHRHHCGVAQTAQADRREGRRNGHDASSFLDSPSMSQKREELLAFPQPWPSLPSLSVAAASSAKQTSSARGTERSSVPVPSASFLALLPRPKKKSPRRGTGRRAKGRLSVAARRQQRISLVMSALAGRPSTSTPARERGRRVKRDPTLSLSFGLDEERVDEERVEDGVWVGGGDANIGVMADFDPLYTTAGSRLANPIRKKGGQPALFAPRPLCLLLRQHQFEAVRFIWSRLMRDPITTADLAVIARSQGGAGGVDGGMPTVIEAAAAGLSHAGGKRKEKHPQTASKRRGYNPFVTRADVKALTENQSTTTAVDISSDAEGETLSDFALPQLFLTSSQLSASKSAHRRAKASAEGNDAAASSAASTTDATIPRGCILAHEAGSGKTLVVIAFLLLLWAYQRLHPDLAHAPPAFQAPYSLCRKGAEVEQEEEEGRGTVGKGVRTILVVPRPLLAHWTRELGRWPREALEREPVTIFLLDAERHVSDGAGAGGQAKLSLLQEWAASPSDRTVLLTCPSVLSGLLRERQSPRAAPSTAREQEGKTRKPTGKAGVGDNGRRCSMQESFWQDDARGRSPCPSTSSSSDSGEDGEEDEQEQRRAKRAWGRKGPRCPMTCETLLGVDGEAERAAEADAARDGLSACRRLILTNCTLLIVDEAHRIGSHRSSFSSALAAFPPTTLRLALTGSSDILTPLPGGGAGTERGGGGTLQRKELFAILRFVMPTVWGRPSDLSHSVSLAGTGDGEAAAASALPPDVAAVTHFRSAGQLLMQSSSSSSSSVTRALSSPSSSSVSVLPAVMESTVVVDFSALQGSLFRELVLCMADPNTCPSLAGDVAGISASDWLTFVSRTLLISNHCELVQDWCHRQGIDATSTAAAVELCERGRSRKDSLTWALPSFLVPSIFDAVGEPPGSQTAGCEEAAAAAAGEEGTTPQRPPLADREKSATASLQHSWKMRVLLVCMRAALLRQEKLLVFSHSLPSLVLLGLVMRHCSGFVDGVDFALVTASLSAKRRTELCDTFNDPDSPLHVLLVPFAATSLGLELPTAHRIFFMDPSRNPLAELHVVGRVRRMSAEPGKTIYITRLLSNNPVELQSVPSATWLALAESSGGTQQARASLLPLLEDLAAFRIVANVPDKGGEVCEGKRAVGATVASPRFSSSSPLPQPRPTLTRASIGSSFQKQQQQHHRQYLPPPGTYCRSNSRSPTPTPPPPPTATPTVAAEKVGREEGSEDVPGRKRFRDDSRSPTPPPPPSLRSNAGHESALSPLSMTGMLGYMDRAAQRRVERASLHTTQDPSVAQTKPRGETLTAPPPPPPPPEARNGHEAAANTGEGEDEDPVVAALAASCAELDFSVAACFRERRLA